MSQTEHGREFESDINKIHKLFELRGLARLFHVPTKVAILKSYPNGKVDGEKRGKVWVDISGWINRKTGPMPVAMELKCVKGKQIKKSAISPHQRAILAAADQDLTVSTLLIRSIADGVRRQYLIPTSYVQNKVMHLERDFSEYRIPDAPYWTWLDAALTSDRWEAYIHGGWPALKHLTEPCLLGKS